MFRKADPPRYEATRLHLEFIDEIDGRGRTLSRAYTAQAARLLIEMRQRTVEPKEPTE